MQADYASLIDKRQLDSLKKIREADTYAKKLLASPQTPLIPIWAWAQRTTSSEVCRDSQSFFSDLTNPRRQKSRNPTDRDRCRSWPLRTAV
jgi:hypothetical protein